MNIQLIAGVLSGGLGLYVSLKAVPPLGAAGLMQGFRSIHEADPSVPLKLDALIVKPSDLDRLGLAGIHQGLLRLFAGAALCFIAGLLVGHTI